MASMARGRVGLLAGVCDVDGAAVYPHALVDYRRIAGEEHGLSVAPVVRVVAARETRAARKQAARGLASLAARRAWPTNALGSGLDAMERQRRTPCLRHDLLHGGDDGFGL